MPALHILSAQPRQHPTNIVYGRQTVPEQPASDDRARAAHSAPAVNVNGLIATQRSIDGVQNATHVDGRRDPKITYGKSQTAGFRAVLRDKRFVRDEELAVVVGFAGLGQVDESADADIQECLDLLAMCVGVGRTGVGTSQQMFLDDPVAAGWGRGSFGIGERVHRVLVIRCMQIKTRQRYGECAGIRRRREDLKCHLPTIQLDRNA